MEGQDQIKDLLEEKYLYYHSIDFIKDDPIQIPHLFQKKEDIEISGFLTATISWGNRKSIVNNARNLMERMDYAPHEFIIHHTAKDLKPIETFVHRTFNGLDCIYFLKSLKNIYKNHQGLENVFKLHLDKKELFALKSSISGFRKVFLELKHEDRINKHVSDPIKNSSAKRLCMYLRWMVRTDQKKVDFGIWKSISSAHLCLPLDVHTGKVSQILGLTTRQQQDWKTVEEITSKLRQFDPLDPVKYDFALFGMGVEKVL